MEKGFNTDISVEGTRYHVQTEDWGHANPFLVTRIFRDGAVIKSFKTPYREILERAPKFDQQVIRLAMREQHERILDRLVSGQLDSARLR
ncbi:MAG TPA: hypothetical protein VFV50_09100 [Bdellovibrionales bacterium]|nr:hypothetical protein [Bdellovibrionales bacterium]